MNSNLRRQEKKARREARKERLQGLSEARIAKRGAPNFGISEESYLRLQQQVEKLTVANNSLVEELEGYKKLDVADKACEAHHMMSVVITLLTQKGIFQQEEVQALAEAVQAASMGVVPKQGVDGGAPEAMLGDTIVVRFKVFDGEEVVEDQTKSRLAYIIGTNGFGCDEALVGIKPGETRSVTAKFSDGYHIKSMVGKPLMMVIECVGIMVSAPKS